VIPRPTPWSPTRCPRSKRTTGSGCSSRSSPFQREARSRCLFENGKAKPVEEHQIALFRQQGFDLGDAEESRELHIKVPPDPEEPVDEVSFEDAFEEGDLTQDAPPPEVDDNENASEGTPSTDTTTEV
jgi:hypothetical protein